MMKRLSCLMAALAALAPAAATANCATANTGAGCASVDGVSSTQRFAPGDRLPPGRYNVLLNTEYYGLPAAGSGWRYYEVDGRVLRVETGSLEVLEDMTLETNGAW